MTATQNISPSKTREEPKQYVSPKPPKREKAGSGSPNAKKEISNTVVASVQKTKHKANVLEAMRHTPPERDFLDTVDLDHSLKEDCKEPDCRALGLAIAERAYQLYEERGGEPGKDVGDCWMPNDRFFRGATDANGERA